MKLSVGIIGLPNVGKSTLFNALLKKQQAYVSNYPFTTIEPNVGIVPVPDLRLQILAEIVAKDIKKLSNEVIKESSLITNNKLLNYPPIKPATVKFVDIAGLVKGSSSGAGLGNKFLSHIREVNIIAHVVRIFTDSHVIRAGSSDPETDYATVQTELILADLQTIEHAKRKSQHAVLERLSQALNSGVPVRDIRLTNEEQVVVSQLFLLSAKPEVVALNVSEDEYSLVNSSIAIEQYSKLLLLPKTRFVLICAKIESDLSELPLDEQKEYLRNVGIAEAGLERLIQKAYQTLGLISFFTTTGEKEVRAWTLRAGPTAITAAGTIHSDFAKHFIKAEVIPYEDFVKLGGWKKARELGKTRFEGKEYIMQDGEVVEFKIHS